jgi:hypothetical protein
MSAQPKEAFIYEARTEVDGVVHQTLRREVNEQVRKLGAGLDGSLHDAIDVVCECGYSGCTGRLTMTVADYEAVRRFPTRFLVKAGHEVSEFERVVAESDAYVVVEKVGRGGSYAVGIDPRRRASRRANGAA